MLSGLSSIQQLRSTPVVLWRCYLSGSGGDSATLLTFIICGCSQSQTSARSSVGSSPCLLFPLPLFHSFHIRMLGNNLPCLCLANPSFTTKKKGNYYCIFFQEFTKMSCRDKPISRRIVQMKAPLSCLMPSLIFSSSVELLRLLL